MSESRAFFSPLEAGSRQTLELLSTSMLCYQMLDNPKGSAQTSVPLQAREAGTGGGRAAAQGRFAAGGRLAGADSLWLPSELAD